MSIKRKGLGLQQKKNMCQSREGGFVPATTKKHVSIKREGLGLQKKPNVNQKRGLGPVKKKKTCVNQE